MATTPNYEINYEDERFQNVDAAIDEQSQQIDQAYGGMISETDKYYDAQIQASKDWADKQAQIQQENTDFTIEKIEQEKDKANKDYLKEQSGAYVDWRKQSNQYGTEAEKMASAGLSNTGFSESSQVSMYNTYQNRVATARESYNYAVLNYNNAIKDAQLQNNAALAEIAYNALQQQLELSLQGFQYKNQLVLEQANKKIELENTKWNRYQDVLQQINTENALAEDVRQYNETMAWETEQAELEREFKAQEAELDRQFQAEQAKIERDFKAAQAELDRKHDKAMLEAQTAKEKELLKIQHQNDMAKLKQQQANAIAQLNKQLENDKALLKYEQSLKSSSSTKITSGSTSGSSNKKDSVAIGAAIASFSGTSYKDAVAFLKGYGIDGSGAMTESEWSRRKNAGSTATEVKNYSSYAAYIKDYVAYRMEKGK